MKQKIFAMPCYLVIASIILLASCKKGDKGDTGAPGPAGTPGAPGAPGAAGTANIVYSAWLDVAYNAEIDPVRFSANILAPKLVDSILSKGNVIVYLNYGSATNPDVVPLPVFDPIYYPTEALTLLPDFFIGKIVLTSNYNMGTFNDSGEKVFQYRYVIIPGGTAARAAAGGKTIDWNNYKEVQAYLGLKD